ncbi:hypothetical protein EV384_1500 [Micromonospora kangleipakensis]|uniref:Uncharacterized protein n=1 Tax=Micromonospora kangleipakensis TaxID=1077942 RepID=A0A4Q8B835_9ACTN|nr:hypothetical protein [Micromonospora kangleipakensis]RZU73103.1 hypothetical protein EV384_1500 [Micromonospora kangleipakensis]
MPTPLRRSPLPPILLVLVPLSLLQTLWRLLPLPDADAPRVINGVLVLPPAGWLEVVVVAVAWTWAVTAGVAALAGADRPLRRALRLLPTVCGVLFAALAAVLVAFLLVGLVLPAAEEMIWVVVALLAVPVGALLVRLGLVLPLTVFEDLRGMAAVRAASAGVRGYGVSIAILLLLGVLGPAVLTGWAWERAGPLVDGRLPGLGLWLARDVVLVLLAALQAGTFVVAYRNLPQPRLAALSPASGAEGRVPRWAGLGFALVAMLLPTLVTGGVVTTGFLTELSVRPGPLPRNLVALGWPAGRHPVILTYPAIYDCLDDECRATRRTKLPISLASPEGAVIAADGSVYALTGNRLTYCDPRRTCRSAPSPLDALAGDWEAAAIALAPDGQILIGIAAPALDRGDGQLRREDSEVGLIRCRDVHCTAPDITRLGVAQNGFADMSSAYYRRLLVGVDRRGRPVVAYRPTGGSMVWVGRCDTPGCASAQLALLGSPEQPGLPTEEELASLHFDRLVPPCDRCTSAVSATVDRPGGGIYAVAITYGRPDVRVRIGERTLLPRRAVLWSCADYRCWSPREVPLIEAQEWSSNVPGPSSGDAFLLAANPDGRVVVARRAAADQIVTVRP